MARPLHPRFLVPRLEEALLDTPVLLIHGPRQSGKTTLAKSLGERHGHKYFSLDDDNLLRIALDDPVGFVRSLPEKAILDEIQRAPELFSTIKLLVDEQRSSGRFILTGSANVLLVPRLSDSLAGRMEIQRLFPLTQSELHGAPSRFIDALLAGDFKAGVFEPLGRELVKRVVAGGYPAALAMNGQTRRSAWYADYVETQVQRDVRDLSRIHALDALPRLLSVSAASTGRLVNFEELASPFEISRNTIQDYVALLERVFLLERLPAWHSNRLNRLVKRPKLHLGDTGVAAALLRVKVEDLLEQRPLFGQLLETFVYQEVRRQASWREDRPALFHFRDRDQSEVDLVIEAGPKALAGIEVKAAASVRTHDFKGLRKLRDAVGAGFRAGALLYDGTTLSEVEDRLFAVPIRLLWELR